MDARLKDLFNKLDRERKERNKTREYFGPLFTPELEAGYTPIFGVAVQPDGTTRKLSDSVMFGLAAASGEYCITRTTENYTKITTKTTTTTGSIGSTVTEETIEESDQTRDVIDGQNS